MEKRDHKERKEGPEKQIKEYFLKKEVEKNTKKRAAVKLLFIPVFVIALCASVQLVH